MAYGTPTPISTRSRGSPTTCWRTGWRRRADRLSLPFQKGVISGKSGRSHARRASMRRSEEHTSELQSLMRISYAVFCLKKNKHTHTQPHYTLTTSPTYLFNLHRTTSLATLHRPHTNNPPP